MSQTEELAKWVDEGKEAAQEMERGKMRLARALYHARHGDLYKVTYSSWQLFVESEFRMGASQCHALAATWGKGITAGIEERKLLLMTQDNVEDLVKLKPERRTEAVIEAAVEQTNGELRRTLRDADSDIPLDEKEFETFCFVNGAKQTVETAIARVRQDSGDDLSKSRCIELACADFIGGSSRQRSAVTHFVNFWRAADGDIPEGESLEFSPNSRHGIRDLVEEMAVAFSIPRPKRVVQRRPETVIAIGA